MGRHWAASCSTRKITNDDIITTASHLPMSSKQHPFKHHQPSFLQIPGNNPSQTKRTSNHKPPQLHTHITSTTTRNIKMASLTSRTALIARRVATQATKSTILPRAAFSTTNPHQKSAVASAKDTLKSVDRTVSDKLVDGIDIGSSFHLSFLYPTPSPPSPFTISHLISPHHPSHPPHNHNHNRPLFSLTNKRSNNIATVAGKLKDAASDVQSGKTTATQKASELAGEAKGAASNLAGQAKGKVGEVAGEARGKANEVAGEARSKANEVAGEARGKANEVAGEVRGKANEVAGEVRGKAGQMAGEASEVAGKARGAKEEVKGHAKGAKEDVKRTLS
jgi:hypothetical protein